jgi:AcrR family transcriptional regulator
MKTPRPFPGRPRRFDEGDAVARAMRSFWREGFSGVGTRALAEAMGVGASSFANTFGTKAELLARALETYDEAIRADVLPALADGDGRAAVTGFFTRLADWLARGEGGCLLLNLSMEPGRDEPSRRVIGRYQQDLRRGLAGALRRAEPGLSGTALEARTAVVFLLVLGMSSASRAGASARDLRQLATAAESLVDAWSQVRVRPTSTTLRRRRGRTPKA